MMEFYVDDFENYEHLGHFYTEGDVEGPEGDRADEGADRRHGQNSESESDIDVLDPDPVAGEGDDDHNVVQEEAAAALDMSQEGCCVEAENQQNLRWSQGLSDVRIREFSQSSGPQHSLPLDATPLDYFLLLWPESLFETITEETNRYAEQRMAAAKKKDPYWVPTAVNEIKAFFALAIMMGIKNLPRLYCYWAGNVALRCDWISGTMSHSRYVKINQYLHVRNNKSVPRVDRRDYDPIFKVRNVVETVRENFGRYYYPHCEVAVDEGMIPFKGRLFFKQHMPAKPTKWGVKVWELCESETGYCLNFDIYTGRNRKAGPTHGLGHQVVMSLTQPYWHRNHHVYFDRFFSSPRLLEDMLKCSLYGCSTININRVGLPDEAKQLKLRNKGDVEFFQKGNLVLTVWRDKRVVVMLTSNSEGKMLTLPDGRLKPDAIMKYNKYMGGVDRSDQYRSYYHVGRTSKKWWRYIIWFLVNLSIVNAWLLYRESKHDPPPPKGYDHFQFRIELAEQLRAGFSGRCQTKGRKPKHDRSECYAEAIGAHKLVRIPNRKRVCRECSQNGRKTRSGRQIQTSFRCGICDLPLCRARCFREYHKSIAADAAIVEDVGGEDKEDEEDEEREEGGEGEVEEADVEIVSVNGPNVASAACLGDQEVSQSPAPREPSFSAEASSTSEAAEVAGDRREVGVGTQEPSLVDPQSQASAQPANPVCSGSTEGVSGVAVCGTSTEDDDLVIIVESSTPPPVLPNFQEKRAIVKIKTRKRQRKAKSKSGPMTKKDVSTSTSVDASEGILTRGTGQATSAPAGPDGRDSSAEAAARANEIIVIDLTDEEEESDSLQQQLLPPAHPLVPASKCKKKKKKRPKKRRSKNRNAGEHKKKATDSSTKKRKTAIKEKVAVSSQRKGAPRACKAAGIGVYQDKVNCSGRSTPRAHKQAPDAVIIDLTGEDEVAPESSVDMADSTLPLARLGDTDGAQVMMEAADKRKENNIPVAVDGDVSPKEEPADQSLSKGVPSAVCHQPQEDVTRGEDESEAVVCLISDDAIPLGGAGHVYPQQRHVTSAALRADEDPTRQAEGTAATDFNIKAERGDVGTATAFHPENASAEMERTKMVLREGSGDKSADEDVNTHRPEEAVVKDVAKDGAPQKSGEEITVPQPTAKLEKTDARTPASDLLHSPPTVLVPGVDVTGTVAINPTEDPVLVSIGGTLLSVAGSRRDISKDTTREHAEQSQMARPTESNNPHRGADPKGATDESDIVDRCRLMTSTQCEASARADVGDGRVRDTRLCETQSRQGKRAPCNAAEETASAKDVGNIGDLTSSSCSTSSSTSLPSSSSFIDVISTTTTWTPSGIQNISDRMGTANLWRTTHTHTQNCVCFNPRALDDSVEVATDSNQEEHKITGVSENDVMTDADQPKKPTAPEKDKPHYIDEYIETLSPMKIDNEVILSPIETMRSTNATVSSGHCTKTTHLNQSHGEWKEYSNVTVDDILSNLRGKVNKTGNASDTNDTAHAGTGTASVGNWSRGGDTDVSSQVSDKEEIWRIDKQHIDKPSPTDVDNKVTSSQGSNVDLVKTVHTMKPPHDETKLDMTPIYIDDDDDDETVSSPFTDTTVIPVNKGNAKNAANTTGSAVRKGCATDAGESEKHKCPQRNIPGYQESATDGQDPNTRGAKRSYNVREEDVGVIYIDDDDDDDNSSVSFAEVSSSKRIDNAATGETGQDESRKLFHMHNGDTDCRNRKGREINVDKLVNTRKGVNPQIEVSDRAESCDIRREKHPRLDDTIQIGETGKDALVAQDRADDDALAPDMDNHDDAPPDPSSASDVNIAASAEMRRVSETADGMGAGEIQRFDNTITIEGVIDAGDETSESPDEGDAGEHRIMDNNAQRVGTQEENHRLFDEAAVNMFSSSSSVINISTMPTTTSCIAPSAADDKGSENVRKSTNADITNICNAQNKTNTTRAGAYQKDQASSGIVEDTQISIARYSAGRPQPKSAVLSPSSLSSSLIDISSTSTIDSTMMTRMTDDRGAGYFRKTGSATTGGRCHDAKDAQNTMARAAHSTGQGRASSGLADDTTRPESDNDGVQVSRTREEHSHHRRDEETPVSPTEGNRDEDSSLLSATEISVDSANKSKHVRGRAFEEDVGDKWKKTGAITDETRFAVMGATIGVDKAVDSNLWGRGISMNARAAEDDSPRQVVTASELCRDAGRHGSTVFGGDSPSPDGDKNTRDGSSPEQERMCPSVRAEPGGVLEERAALARCGRSHPQESREGRTREHRPKKTDKATATADGTVGNIAKPSDGTEKPIVHSTDFHESSLNPCNSECRRWKLASCVHEPRVEPGIGKECVEGVTKRATADGITENCDIKIVHPADDEIRRRQSAINALNACDLGSPDTGAISTQWEGHGQEISHKLLSIQDDSRGLEQDSNSAPTSGCHTHVVSEPMDTNEGICCRKDSREKPKLCIDTRAWRPDGRRERGPSASAAHVGPNKSAHISDDHSALPKSAVCSLNEAATTVEAAGGGDATASGRDDDGNVNAAVTIVGRLVCPHLWDPTPSTSVLNRSHKSRFQQRGIKRPATENECMDPCETQSDATTAAEVAWPGEAAFTVPSDAKRARIREEQPQPDQEVQDAGSVAGCGDDEAISPFKIIAPQADPDLLRAFNSPPSRLVLSSKLDFPAEATLAQLIGQQRSSRPGTSVDEPSCLTLSGVATRSLGDDLEMGADAKPSKGIQDSLLTASSFASCGSTSISPRAEPSGARRGRLVVESMDSSVGSSRGSAFCLALVTGSTKDDVCPSQERHDPEPSVNSSPSEGTRGCNEQHYTWMAEDNAGDVEAPGRNDEELGGNDEAPGSNDEGLGGNDEAPGSNDEAPGSNDKAPGSNDEASGCNDEAQVSNDEAPGSNDEVLGGNDEVLGVNYEAPGSNDEAPGSNDEAPGSNDEVLGGNDEAIGSNYELLESNNEAPGDNDEAPGSNDETRRDNIKALGGDNEAIGSNGEALGSNDEALGSNDEALGSNDEALGSNDEALRGSDEAPVSNDEAPGSNDEVLGGNDEVLGVNDEAPGSNDEAPGSNDEAPGSNDEVLGGNDEAIGSNNEAIGSNYELLESNNEAPGDNDEAPGSNDETRRDNIKALGDNEAIGSNGEALGSNDEALGSNDEALGSNDEALGSNDEALRGSDEALGSNDEALGSNDEALGSNDEALRGSDEALGSNDEALGCNDEALGSNDEALGSDDEALGSNDEALGGSDEALGSNDEALGRNDEALGGREEALGSNDESLGSNDEALGGREEAMGSNDEALGSNDEALGSNDEALGSNDEARDATEVVAGERASSASDESRKEQVVLRRASSGEPEALHVSVIAAHSLPRRSAHFTSGGSEGGNEEAKDGTDRGDASDVTNVSTRVSGGGNTVGDMARHAGWAEHRHPGAGSTGGGVCGSKVDDAEDDDADDADDDEDYDDARFGKRVRDEPSPPGQAKELAELAHASAPLSTATNATSKARVAIEGVDRTDTKSLGTTTTTTTPTDELACAYEDTTEKYRCEVTSRDVRETANSAIATACARGFLERSSEPCVDVQRDFRCVEDGVTPPPPPPGCGCGGDTRAARGGGTRKRALEEEEEEDGIILSSGFSNVANEARSGRTCRRRLSAEEVAAPLGSPARKLRVLEAAAAGVSPQARAAGQEGQ
uniref:Uncharacterized protein LOC116948512 isoform X2 n=1 Tax=Petromyzon marinus TaxID=7757 RepID=A0AAJ7TQF1_PETMA|nr:uncharacterized protein LOC116948512 isoform X2 [Petromyzon marinus]